MNQTEHKARAVTLGHAGNSPDVGTYNPENAGEPVHLHTDIRREIVELIFEEWEDERSKLFALTGAIGHLLRPEKDGDSPEENAWRLCQIAQEILGSVGNTNAMRKIALGVSHKEMS